MDGLQRRGDSSISISMHYIITFGLNFRLVGRSKSTFTHFPLLSLFFFFLVYYLQIQPNKQKALLYFIGLSPNHPTSKTTKNERPKERVNNPSIFTTFPYTTLPSFSFSLTFNIHSVHKSTPFLTNSGFLCAYTTSHSSNYTLFYSTKEFCQLCNILPKFE